MPHPPSKNASSATSNTQADDLFDLHLPKVPPGEEPLPAPPASPEAILAHVRLLLPDCSPDFWQKRAQHMLAEPFRLD